ncbi:MAG: putative monovalent cation/H+ antiporter subunit A [Gammaproteobacteria bacterium]
MTINIAYYLLIGLIPCCFFSKRYPYAVACLAIIYLIPILLHSLSLTDFFAFNPITWTSYLDIKLAFNLNGLNKLFLFLISFIGILVFAYAISYYYDAPTKLARLSVLLQIFTVSMIALMLADHLLILFVAWELTTLCSFLLIQFYYQDDSARDAALQGMFITVLGGLALLCGLIGLHQYFNTWSLSAIINLGNATSEQADALFIPFILILLGAITKSAQFPFYFWLPQAMKAPTPVSAFLHSATMVNAGIYLLARLHPLFITTNYWYPLISTIGLSTMLVSGFLALVPDDMKKILAYTTVFALGSMLYLLGGSDISTAEALVALLLAHAFYKSLLFMMVGIIYQRYKTRNLSELQGIARYSLPLAGIMTIGTMMMAGLPPFFGFVAKQLVYEAKLAGDTISWPLITLSLIASMLTAAASFKILIALMKPSRGIIPQPRAAMPYGYVLPGIIAVMTITVGFIPQQIESYLLDPAAIATISHINTNQALQSNWQDWPTSISLSLLTVLGGFIFCFYKKPLIQFIAKQKIFHILSPAKLLNDLLNLILNFGKWITRVTQHISLTQAIFTSLCAIIIVLAYPLFHLDPLTTHLPLQQQTMIAANCLVLILGAIGVLLAHTFINALISLSVVGLGLALFFTILGAPDVAITQLLIEILTIIIIGIIFRYSRTLFINKTTLTYHCLSIVIALLFGISLSIILLSMLNTHFDTQLSNYYINTAVPLAYGRNVVNVILVDFRALDTLGEVLVVAMAAVGVLTLLNMHKRLKTSKPHD